VEVAHFIECAVTGAEPRTGPESGLAVTATLEAAAMAMDQDRSLALDEVLVPAGLSRDALRRTGVSR
jgi:predicted dehydrogenase